MGNILITLAGIIVMLAAMWMFIMGVIQLGDDDEFKKWLNGK